ncbi:MAG: hypothetical protein KKA84_02315 [Bacteroidetes bacterium]|nr:hypothetical protein [Bacteroidota bacterium]
MRQSFINGEKVETGLGEIEIVSELGKGKSGFSFKAIHNNKEVVLKVMHNESAPYYSFNKNKVILETNAYELLERLGAPVPELLYSNIEENYLIKNYVHGKTGSDWIIQDSENEIIIKQLFEISKKLESHKINIDYFPSNFVIDNDRLYYIDYEVNNYDPEWSFLNWGIYYWANREGFTKFMKEGDATAINVDVDKGQPHKEPFREIVNTWIQKYL